MTVGTNVLVVADAGRGFLTGPARELPALGRSLADAFGGSVDFLALGAPASKLAADVTAAGADRICVAEEADRPGYHPEPFAALVLAACRELAPRVVFGIGARWAANCVGVEVEAGILLCQRAEVSGKIRVVEAIDGLGVLTLRPKSVDALAPQPGRQASFMSISAPETPEGAVVFVERRQEDGGAAAELEQAAMVVTGGLRRVAAHGRLPEVEADRRRQSISCRADLPIRPLRRGPKWEEVAPELLARLPMAAH